MRPVLMVPVSGPVKMRLWSEVSLGLRSWCLERYAAGTKRLWTVWTKRRCPVCLISSTLFLDDERTFLRLTTWGRALSSFGVIIFNRCQRSPCAKLLPSRTRRRTFYVALCGTPIKLDNYFWESPRPENRTIYFNDYRTDIDWHDCHLSLRW